MELTLDVETAKQAEILEVFLNESPLSIAEVYHRMLTRRTQNGVGQSIRLLRDKGLIHQIAKGSYELTKDGGFSLAVWRQKQNIKHRPQDPVFCPPNCRWLSLTEAQQDERGTKEPHRCSRFAGTVYHRQYHPNLVRLSCCVEDPSSRSYDDRQPAKR